MFRLWLKRSRYCPLHLRLGTDRAWVSDTVVEAAVAHRARWQYLTIGLDTEEGDFRLFDGPMPLLRHLELIVEPDEDSPGSIPFHEAPLLSTATLNEAAALRVRLPWVQLTSLTLLNVAPSECVPILVQTSNLLHCELYVCFDTSSDPEIRRDITLPRLQSLVLADPGERFVSDLLPRLIVPTLRSLRIPHYFLAPDPIDTVSAFLSKSGCTLGSLHVISAPSIPWMPYRQEFPSLWELSFTS
ncbi:hypothetical protein DFH06DRAFT_1225065 [Mycena polygramma]|nr:hypothetical protein DFH06DRAFT_1225065 [Mycena polygramma]